MNYRKIEFERFVRDIILGLFRYQSVSKHTGEKISKVFPINLLRVTIKVSMNVLKANRRELGVNRESCGISIEFIHAGQSYHRLGQSLWHLIPNTFPMVALYTDSVNQRLIGWPTCDTPLFPKVSNCTRTWREWARIPAAFATYPLSLTAQVLNGEINLVSKITSGGKERWWN